MDYGEPLQLDYIPKARVPALKRKTMREARVLAHA